MCAAWVVVDGERLRPRSPEERTHYHARGGHCSYGCAAGSCAIEEGADAGGEAVIRTWALCGGRNRWCWPAGGALGEQRAVTVAQFETIDGLVAQAQARAVAKG